MQIFVGIDVGKLYLDICYGDKHLRIKNTEQDILSFIKQLNTIETRGDPIALIVCEATGGYERLLVSTLHHHKLPIHVAHANKIRAFAKTKGQLAKTDKIDAAIIYDYAKTIHPKADDLLIDLEAEKLSQLLKRREQLLMMKLSEENRLENEFEAFTMGSIKKHVKWLINEIKQVEKAINETQKQERIKAQLNLLLSIPGVGKISALTIIAFLPELGKLTHKELAALVGVAPFNRDSGKYRGKRFIQGGRAAIRKVLYMAAVSSMRCNADMKLFYQRLASKGKSAKVILVAIIRKLLLTMNSIIKRQTPWVEKTI